MNLPDIIHIKTLTTICQGISAEQGILQHRARDARLEFLSDSDIEAIDATVSYALMVPSWVIIQHTNDSVYKRVWENGAGIHKPLPVNSIALTLEDGHDLIDHLNGWSD